MGDPIIDIIKAELRPGYDYNEVTVKGKYGAYRSHRWMRRGAPDNSKDLRQLQVEAKKFLAEQMIPRRAELRGQWQGWVEHVARLKAMLVNGHSLVRPEDRGDVRRQLLQAKMDEKKYGKLYRAYRLEHMDYVKFVKEIEGRVKAPKQAEQGALFPKEGLTKKPESPTTTTARYKHQFDASSDITHVLATGEILSRKYMGGGTADAYKLTLEGGKKAVWKEAHNEDLAGRNDIPSGGTVWREAESYNISEALGWHLCPPTTVRVDDLGDLGSAMLFDKEADKATGCENVIMEDRWKMAVLDIILGSEDRHGKNFMVRYASQRDKDNKQNGRVVAIDHGLGLSEDGNIDWFRSAFWKHLVELDDAKKGSHTRLPSHSYDSTTSRRLPMPDNLMEDVKRVDWPAVVEHARIWVGPKAADNLDDRVSFLMGKRELFDDHDTEFQTKYRPARAKARGHRFVKGKEIYD